MGERPRGAPLILELTAGHGCLSGVPCAPSWVWAVVAGTRVEVWETGKTFLISVLAGTRQKSRTRGGDFKAPCGGPL